MAIYINLGIDCGVSHEIAEQIVAHFGEFVIDLPEVEAVACEIWTGQNFGHWFVGVWPRGLGYATLRFNRPELLSHEAVIGDTLYGEIARIDGYRRAMYGAEAFDVFLDGTPEELDDINCTALVYRSADFSAPPQGRDVSEFRPGYSIVLARPGQQPAWFPKISMNLARHS